MNVSFTRARSKLIIIGSRKTLQSTPLPSHFFTLMDGKKWILSLPPNADKMYSHAVQPIVARDPLWRSRPPGDYRANQEDQKATADVGVLRGRRIMEIMFGRKLHVWSRAIYYYVLCIVV
jgi:DNA replication ATP-dependent helicase Dna2